MGWNGKLSLGINTSGASPGLVKKTRKGSKTRTSSVDCEIDKQKSKLRSVRDMILGIETRLRSQSVTTYDNVTRTNQTLTKLGKVDTSESDTGNQRQSCSVCILAFNSFG